MDREIQQLKEDRDRYRSEFERNQLLLNQANKRLAENIQYNDDYSSSQRMTTNSSYNVKTSNVVTSKTIDPNYRGEAFGK